MLEDWTEKLLSNSFLARAIRKTTAKSVLLGYLDAMQRPDEVLGDITKDDGSEGTAEPDPPTVAASPAPIALPVPGLLGVATNSNQDAPDRPGVPPKRVRKFRKGDAGPEELARDASPAQSDDTHEKGVVES